MENLPTIRDLVVAVIHGEIDRVRALRDVGVSVTQPDEHGWLPLHWAAVNNR